jgi:imidazolonepropionase-like amidohydrolase
MRTSRSQSFIRPALALVTSAAAFLTLAAASRSTSRSTSGTAAREAPRAQPAPPVAFVDVAVVPMDGDRVVAGQTVVVRGDRIAAIGAAGRVEVPANAVRVDGRGKYLMPGLAEMHAHIPSAGDGGAEAERTLFLYLAHGITTIRGMLGEESHLALRERAARGEIASPRIYTSGPSLSGQSAPTPDAARRAVIAQKAAGYDLIKLHPGLSRATFDAIDRTADSVGIPYAGHVSVGVGLARALEARYHSIDHLDGYLPALVSDSARLAGSNWILFGLDLLDAVDESRIAELARRTREAGVWNVPTLSLFPDWFGATDSAALRARPDVRYVSPATVDAWMRQVAQMRRSPGWSSERVNRFVALRRRVLRSLHEAGAPLLLGADAPQIFQVPGAAAHEELAEMVAAGLTPYQALATGTVNVARFFGVEGERGTVAQGKAADLVLLDANPLADIANARRIAGVMARGHWVPGTELQRRLDAIAAEVRR